jgi:protease I
VKVDKTINEANPADYDALLVPGGFINPDLLRQSAEARHFVRAFDEEGKPIATLCHGPWVLASAGLTSGRTMTSWPGIRDDLVNAGATWLDQEVVHDDNWVSSRGPQDMVPFGKAMTKLFAGEPLPEKASPFAKSDPQRREPPNVVIGAMKWLPRPSIRTAVGLLAALGAGLWATGRKRAFA